MGDYSDYRQIDRIMKTESGKNKLDILKNSLEGHSITNVSFTNETNSIGILLNLDNDLEVLLTKPDLMIDALLDDEEILSEERDLYYKEHPVLDQIRKQK